MSLRLSALVTLFMSLLIGQPPSSVIDAVHKGHAVGHEPDGIAAVREALAAGGDVNERDKIGWTPLMHACLECRADIVKLLLASQRVQQVVGSVACCCSKYSITSLKDSGS